MLSAFTLMADVGDAGDTTGRALAACGKTAPPELSSRKRNSAFCGVEIAGDLEGDRAPAGDDAAVVVALVIEIRVDCPISMTALSDAARRKPPAVTSNVAAVADQATGDRIPEASNRAEIIDREGDGTGRRDVDISPGVEGDIPAGADRAAEGSFLPPSRARRPLDTTANRRMSVPAPSVRLAPCRLRPAALERWSLKVYGLHVPPACARMFMPASRLVSVRVSALNRPPTVMFPPESTSMLPPFCRSVVSV